MKVYGSGADDFQKICARCLRRIVHFQQQHYVSNAEVWRCKFERDDN